MNAIQVIIKSINVQTLWLGVASVAAGAAAATAHGYAEIFPTLLCLVFAILAQCTGNIGHRYYDEKFGYGENLRDGMTHEDEEGRSIMYILREGLRVFSILTLTAGLALLMTAGWWTIIPGVIIMTINWLNNHGKHPWSQSLLYPLITFFIFGPIAVLSTQMVISTTTDFGEWTWWDMKPGVVMSVVIGIMAMNSHILYRASHAMQGIGVLTSFTGTHGVRFTAILLTVTTLIYTTVLGAAPIEMSIYTDLGFLILPTVSMILSFVQIYLLMKSDDPSAAWDVSLANIMLVSIASLLFFWFLGYPNINDLSPDQILNLL